MIPSYFVFQWDNIKMPSIKNLIVKDVAGIVSKLKIEKANIEKMFQGVSTLTKPVRKLRYTVGPNLPLKPIISVVDTTADVDMTPIRGPIIRLAQALVPRAVLNESVRHEVPEIEYTGPSKYAKNFQPFGGGARDMKSVSTPIVVPDFGTPVWTPSAFEIPTQTSSDYSIFVDDDILPNPSPKKTKINEGEVLIAPNVVQLPNGEWRNLEGSGMYSLGSDPGVYKRRKVESVSPVQAWIAKASGTEFAKGYQDVLRAAYRARDTRNKPFLDMALATAKDFKQFGYNPESFSSSYQLTDAIASMEAQAKYLDKLDKHRKAIRDVVASSMNADLPHISDLIEDFVPYENRVVELD